VVLALLIHTLWGGNPVAVKLGLEALPPLGASAPALPGCDNCILTAATCESATQ
jgi:hypothetical protein